MSAPLSIVNAQELNSDISESSYQAVFQDKVYLSNPEDYLYARGGVTKVVNTWKGFDVYLKDSHARNVSDAQQIAGILAPFVGGPIGVVMGAALLVSSVAINRVNRGNGIIIAFVGKSINPPPIVHWISAQ